MGATEELGWLQAGGLPGRGEGRDGVSAQEVPSGCWLMGRVPWQSGDSGPEGGSAEGLLHSAVQAPAAPASWKEAEERGCG